VKKLIAVVAVLAVLAAPAHWSVLPGAIVAGHGEGIEFGAGVVPPHGADGEVAGHGEGGDLYVQPQSVDMAGHGEGVEFGGA